MTDGGGKATTENSWAKPGPENMDPVLRDKEESRDFYETLQDHVVPLYYSRDKAGYSSGWVKMAKDSMISLLPRYNAARMVNEYAHKFYMPASKQGRRYAENGFDPAKKIADWKVFVRKAWGGVRIRRLDSPAKRISFGDALQFKVAVRLNGLRAEDIVVELLVSRQIKKSRLREFKHYTFEPAGEESGEQIFQLNLTPDLCGKLEYFMRAYPYHPLLTHRFEMGMMVWA